MKENKTYIICFKSWVLKEKAPDTHAHADLGSHRREELIFYLLQFHPWRQIFERLYSGRGGEGGREGGKDFAASSSPQRRTKREPKGEVNCGKVQVQSEVLLL